MIKLHRLLGARALCCCFSCISLENVSFNQFKPLGLMSFYCCLLSKVLLRLLSLSIYRRGEQQSEKRLCSVCPQRGQQLKGQQMGLFPSWFGGTHGGTHPARCYGQGACFDTSKTSSLARNRGICWFLNLAILDLPLGWELNLLWVQHLARMLSDLHYPLLSLQSPL